MVYALWCIAGERLPIVTGYKCLNSYIIPFAPENIIAYTDRMHANIIALNVDLVAIVIRSSLPPVLAILQLSL